MATPQTQAIEVTNGLILAAQQAMALYATLTALNQNWVDNAVPNTVAAFSTVALNGDGSLGAADSAPNTSHPIDTTKYPLERAISSFEISQIKSVLDGFVAYINGQAVTTQPGAHAILNVAVGG